MTADQRDTLTWALDAAHAASHLHASLLMQKMVAPSADVLVDLEIAKHDMDRTQRAVVELTTDIANAVMASRTMSGTTD